MNSLVDIVIIGPSNECKDDLAQKIMWGFEKRGWIAKIITLPSRKLYFPTYAHVVKFVY